MIDLARTRTDPDEWTDFIERGAGCREPGVTSGTDWAEMRIAKNAWFRFAAAAKRTAFRFRVHGGRHADKRLVCALLRHERNMSACQPHRRQRWQYRPQDRRASATASLDKAATELDAAKNIPIERAERKPADVIMPGPRTTQV